MGKVDKGANDGSGASVVASLERYSRHVHCVEHCLL